MRPGETTGLAGNTDGSMAKLGTGISMWHRVRGAGQPLILIMGTGADHSPWDGAVEAYAPHHQVITFDQRGTGLTDRPVDPQSYSMAVMADDVVSLLDHLGIQRCHVSGMSMGSAIAQEIAIRYPDRVSSLQLHATWGRTDEWLRRMFESLLYLLERPSLDAFFRTDNMWITSASLLERDGEAFAEAERRALEDVHGPTLATLRGHIHADLGHDVLDRLHQIGVPTLVTSGEQDWQVPTRYGVEVAKRIDGSVMHVFKGPRSSHNVFAEMGDEFHHLTLQFLSNHSTRLGG